MRMVAAVVSAGLLVGTGLSGNHQNPRSNVGVGSAPQSVQSVLARAADSVGGAKRLQAIDRLRISVVEKQSRPPISPRSRILKLWLPDRFQNSLPGLVTHTLHGTRLTFDRDVSPEIRGNAERSIPGMFRRVALTFLLRAPGLGRPRLAGDATIEGMSGTVVEFPTPGGSPMKMLFAKDSGQPLAVIIPVRAMGSAEVYPDQVWRLEDYRAVGGVRFPYRLTILHPENLLITEVQQIDVNPPFTAKDFGQ